MHLHVARVRRNGKVYEYAQLVESYRRADGMPTQRVVAKLGAMPPIAIANLRLSLQASRSEQRVVVAGTAATPPRPLQNLRYLDAALLLELWNQLKLGETLAHLLPRGDADISPSDVIAALTIQRGVDPGSKLYAERWFPRTALPELLGIAPAQFNNSRVHRALDLLDSATEPLMKRLPALVGGGAPFVSLFLDATDARFVGHGPDLVQVGKTKEGLIDRKIGIVLLCSDRGFPLRWSVISGKQAETAGMHDVIGDVAGLSWVGDTPVVIDRAMGATAEIEKLLGKKIRFVTALRAPEIPSYTDRIPHEQLADLGAGLDQDATEREAARRVTGAGFQQVSDTMYVLDVGVVEKDPKLTVASASRETAKDLVKAALIAGREIAEVAKSGNAGGLAAAARRLGISKHNAPRFSLLVRLAPELQQMILEDRAVGLSMRQLEPIARMKDSEEQRQAFARLLAAASRPRQRPPRRRSARAAVNPAEPTEPIRVRAAISFNPSRFAEERKNALHSLERMQADLVMLNATLARAPKNAGAIERKLEDTLRRRHLSDLYKVSIEKDGVTDEGAERLQAKLTLDVERWRRRRRYDGFSLIIAHPELAMSGTDLCKLYRTRDAVEKDFQVIKSLVELRPIRHHTDAKIRAHVTVCMLALLLERALRARLRDGTAASALETLATCHLNRCHDSVYLLTEPDAAQRNLLRQLRLEHLVEDDDVAARIHPRPNVSVASTAQRSSQQNA